jgi:NAD(P)-dependent dehydrogenase (short-subunit alcohol dehydrogenase family)
MDINGKTALITGGASGIGRTTAEILAARGASVMLEGKGGRAAFVQADVRDEGKGRREWKRAFGRISSGACAPIRAGQRLPGTGSFGW